MSKSVSIRFNTAHDKFRKFAVEDEVASAIVSGLVQKQPNYFVTFRDLDFKTYVFQTATIEAIELTERT